MSKRRITLRGFYDLTLRGADGSVLYHEAGENMIVDGGLDLVADLVGGLSSTAPLYMALGSSTVAVAHDQTTLQAEAGGGVRKLTSRVRTSPGRLAMNAIWERAENANTTVNEVGIFSASSGGVMFCRYLTQAPIPKDQFDQLEMSYTLVIQDA